jgi:hypothetical protein
MIPLPSWQVRVIPRISSVSEGGSVIYLHFVDQGIQVAGTHVSQVWQPAQPAPEAARVISCSEPKSEISGALYWRGMFVDS